MPSYSLVAPAVFAAGGGVRDGKNTGDKIAGATFIIEVVPPLTFTQARETVLTTVRAARQAPATEEAGLEAAAGRVLAEDIATDRDVPAAARSVRDGYAVRATDLPGELEVIGEAWPGDSTKALLPDEDPCDRESVARI